MHIFCDKNPTHAQGEHANSAQKDFKVQMCSCCEVRPASQSKHIRLQKLYRPQETTENAAVFMPGLYEHCEIPQDHRRRHVGCQGKYGGAECFQIHSLNYSKNCCIILKTSSFIRTKTKTKKQNLQVHLIQCPNECKVNSITGIAASI